MFWGRTASMRGQRVSEVPRAQRFFCLGGSTRGLIGQKINLNQPPNHQLKDHHLKSKVTFDRYRKNLSPTQGNHSWTSSSRSAKFFQAGKDGMGRQKRRRIEALGVWNSNCFQMSTWQREPWGKWSFVLPKSNETLVLGLMLKPHKISSSHWVSASRISVQSRALPLETGRSIYLGCHLLAFQVPQCEAWGWSTKGKAIQLRKYQRILDKWLTNAENINIKKRLYPHFFLAVSVRVPNAFATDNHGGAKESHKGATCHGPL